MGKVVGVDQNAFVAGRQILDASLLANEIVDSLSKRKEKGILCKLDIDKTYDYVRWDFFIQVMRRMSFAEKWTGWTGHESLLFGALWLVCQCT